VATLITDSNPRRKRLPRRDRGERFLSRRELELAEKFEVSRSPVREALVALEKEGTVIISPYKGAIVKPLSAAEVLDIAELRLALISLALKPAYRQLSPADLDHAYDLAKRLTRINNAKDFFEYNCQFWDSIFSKAQRPVLREVFRQLEDRMARYGASRPASHQHSKSLPSKNRPCL
jgi:DNA-binding GntR family transcriptional regulator